VIFPVAFKEKGSDQVDEHPAQGPAQRNHEVEGSEISSRGFQSNQFAMARHAAGKEGGRIDENLEVQIYLRIRIILVQQVNNRGERGQEYGHPDPSVVPSWVIETENEGDEVEAQRKDPKKRDNRDVPTELVRAREKDN
jgi:hypothetical protein